MISNCIPKFGCRGIQLVVHNATTDERNILRQHLRRERNSVLSLAWQDAQHRLEAIAHRARQRTAPHAVDALAGILVAMGHIHPRPIPRRGAVGAVGAAVAAGPAAAQGRDGPEPVRPLFIRPLK